MIDVAIPVATPIPDMLGGLRTNGLGLEGVICTQCGIADLQPSYGCRHCGADEVDPVTISPSCTLYAFTTVYVASGRTTPYTLGYVDLDDGPRLLTSIAASALPSLAIGVRGRVIIVENGRPSFIPEMGDE